MSILNYLIICLSLSLVLNTKAQEPEILLTQEMALVVKDSLENTGWIYREAFPYFYKAAKTNKAPKSCAFSPDGSVISVTLLGNVIPITQLNHKGVGAQLYDIDSLKKFKTLYPPCEEVSKNWGYAEGEWHQKTGEFWMTRMSTGDFFVWHPENDSMEQYKTEGVWTKILRFNPSETMMAMSHWSSNTVTVFDIESRKYLRKMSTGKTPRGIAWANDSIFFVALFGVGDIQVYNANTGKGIYTIKGLGGAARDVEYDRIDSMLYYSNMGLGKVFKYDWNKKEYVGNIKVDSKTNTIRLSPDHKYLYVSCRGPNNKKGYTLPSPRDGDLFVIDIKKWKTIAKWRGGNQPTGLDISPCGRFLAQTDFQEARLTVWLVAL
ncbi:MAG TPA: hypothetical protein EYN71_03785 [Flavobacteriales bacterium]|nr:hypothetical protein [Flavobacteriales bacterium]